MNRFRAALWMVLSFALSACQLFNHTKDSGDYFQTQWESAQRELKNKNDNKAEMLFREIYQLGLEVSPGYSTAALLELSSLSELRGDFVQSLSQLKECESRKQHLAPVRGDLELPARLSGVYAALGEIKASETYAKVAEKSLQTYAAQVRPDQDAKWWAETYYRMSYIPTQFLSDDNWLSFSRRFDSSLPYLIRSMEYADSVWSQRSLDLAQDFFQRTVQLLALPSTQQDENWVLALEKNRQRLDQVLYLIQKARVWRIEGRDDSKWSKGFYSYLSQLEQNMINERALLPEKAPLSSENQKRKSLKRGDINLKTIQQEKND